MSEENNKRQELIEEWAALHSTGAIDGTDAAQLERCLGCPASPMPEAIRQNESAICALAQDLSAAEPPSELKEKILGAVEDRGQEKSSEIAVPQGFSYLLDNEEDWQPLPLPGVRFKKLSEGGRGSFKTMLLDLQPNSRVPGHDHKGAEQIFVLSGDLECEGVIFGAGDLIDIKADTHHGDLYSPSGCRAFTVTESENFPSGAVAAYGMFHRAREKVRGLFGGE